MVDLSKARAGDTVKFRCGGMAVIDKVETEHDDVTDETSYLLWFVNDCGRRSYAEDGVYAPESTSILDITEVIPAPEAFDWDTARWGQAFLDSGSGKIVYFVGNEPLGSNVVMYFPHMPMNHKCNVLHKTDLTRAPEHDIKEGV